MLNPQLFKLLERRFGAGNVKVQSENQEMVCSYKIDPTRSTSDLRSKLEVETSGEEYHVRCPFCQDWKPRLYINHRWGMFDETSRSKNLWLAHCWNEECLSQYGNQVALYDQVFEYLQIGQTTINFNTVRPDRNIAVRQPKKIELPGPMWPLDHMKRRRSTHEAIIYVEDRLWDPVYLAQQYEVGLCLDSFYEQARNRIVAPVRLNGVLVGWQARYVGDAPEGVAKWWTCPGFSCGSALYNHDRMATCQTKVIVEGPADVWNFGPQAAGLFGKQMSKPQKKLLTDCFRPGDVAVILLDPEQDAKSQARGEQHHIEKLYNDLLQEPKLNRRVIRVYLPHGCDPDELDREYMRLLIKEEAKKNKLTVTFSKPTTQLKVTDAA